MYNKYSLQLRVKPSLEVKGILRSKRSRHLWSFVICSGRKVYGFQVNTAKKAWGADTSK